MKPQLYVGFRELAHVHLPLNLSAALDSINREILPMLNSTQQDITDVGADTSYVRIYISNLIKTLWL